MVGRGIGDGSRESFLSCSDLFVLSHLHRVQIARFFSLLSVLRFPWVRAGFASLCLYLRFPVLIGSQLDYLRSPAKKHSRRRRRRCLVIRFDFEEHSTRCSASDHGHRIIRRRRLRAANSASIRHALYRRRSFLTNHEFRS